ncbi:MAG: nucleotidyltransferase domain-containing protein [Bacteroidales bacterium]|nr:nucleotidyltransferase domain-containing protein [Bacteroidales bacterium]
MPFKIDIEAARKFQEEKFKKKQDALDVKFLEAKRDFEAICNMIISEFHPVAVYQWGSLLDRTKFSEISDIDIAVEGITDAQQYFDLLKKAEELSQFPLDIVQLESIHPLHKEMILSRGKIIFKK